jgi:hypothetical protein
MTAPRVVLPSEEEYGDLEKVDVEIVEDDNDGSLVGEGPPGTAHIMTSRIGFELLTRLGQTTIERLCASMRLLEECNDTSWRRSK